VARDFHASSFRGSIEASEDADPRVGLVNLADVMLVFACGLMLAIVAAWNLDISQMQEMVQMNDVTEVTDIDEMTDAQLSGGGGYTEMGTVYQDPMTGKLYMLTEEFKAGEEQK
jgi:hypothetical protein